MKILVGYLGNCTNNGIDVYLLNFLHEIGNEHQVDFMATQIFDTAQEKIKEYNSKIIEIPRIRNVIKRYKKIKEIIKKEKYDVVYLNISEAYNCIEYIVARRLKVDKIILHAHSSGTNSNLFLIRKINKFINDIAKKFIIKDANKYLACSKKAGEWVYGKKIVNSSKFEVIYNAIDFDKFIYNEQTRNEIRKRLNLEDKIILGHIGNFIYQKNHIFLINILEKLVKINSNYHLLLIGKGDYFEKIKRIINKRELSKHVTFLGVIDNVEEILQAMDIFLLPSKFEGLPFVAIEAQASGIYTIVSDNITEEVIISNNIIRIPLNEKKWIQSIKNYSKNRERFIDKCRKLYV